MSQTHSTRPKKKKKMKTAIDINATVLSIYALQPMRKRHIRKLYASMQEMHGAVRRSILYNLYMSYHIRDSMIDPMQAAKELVLRVLYEVLAGYISCRSLCKRRWLDPCLRDGGHHERLMRLVRVVMSNRKAIKFCRRFKWLGFRKAIKKMMYY